MPSPVHSKERFDVHQAVTDKILAAIEVGAGAFVMPWHRTSTSAGRPSNALTTLRYRGVNVITLWAEAALRGYGSGSWATFEQWRQLGAQVRRGEHGTTIVVYKPRPRTKDREDKDAEPKLLARAFRVFNQDQVDGWQAPELLVREPAEIFDQAEAFVASTGARVRHGGDIACFRRSEDRVEIPERSRFVGSSTCTPTEAYYATLFHELIHWTGAEHRLNRQFGARFGDSAYAFEELVAELGAAFLCADLSVTNEPRPDHAAYLTSWVQVLQSDRRAIFTAAQKARDATTFLFEFVDAAPAR